MGSETEPKGYNVFQARLYTITDELAVKQCYIDIEEAKEMLLDCFKDERFGLQFARAVVRCIDPVLKSWIVPWSADNPKAALLDEGVSVVDRWRIALYDMGDKLFCTKTADQPITEQMAQVMMMSENAFYSVISCHEIGDQEHFVICRTYRNAMFNLTVVDDDPERLERQKNEPLEICYQRLLKEDAEETERINAERARRRGTV